MDKKIRILVLISLLVFWGAFLLLYKIRDLDSKDTLNMSFLMRNLSWQTDFLPSVPYKKWDEVEYSAVFSSDTRESLGINIDAIKKNLDITQMEYNDQVIQESSLRSLPLRESGILKITGKAKGISTDKSDAEDVFTVVPVKQEEMKETEDTQSGKILENTGVILAPADIALSATHFSSNIPNLLTISGKNLSSIDFVNIGWISFKPVLSDNRLYIQIDRDVFASGEYFMFYQLKNGKIVTSNTKIGFEYSAEKINIANITPSIIPNDQDRFVVLQGNGFDKIVSIQLSNNLILKNAEFNLISKQVAGVKIPKWLPPGEYYFNIMDLSSIYELKNMHFTIVSP